MTYEEWNKEHIVKRSEILKKLKGKSYKEIREYFQYNNMMINEPDFCGLYKTKTKCHNMKNLNCFCCACPYFKYNDDGLYKKGEYTVYSECSINSMKGKEFIYQNTIHQDCSYCTIPHTSKFALSQIIEYKSKKQ